MVPSSVVSFSVTSKQRIGGARSSRPDAPPGASSFADGSSEEENSTSPPPQPPSPPQPIKYREACWTPDETAFLWGLPGALPPMGNFDPFGFEKNISLGEAKRFREAEVTHGRVAMMAFVGFLVPEAGFHPMYSFMIKVFHTSKPPILTGPAIHHLDEVREVAPFVFEALVLVIALTEIQRSIVGWESPMEKPFTLREEYYPGDVGFDPLGFKPSIPENFPGVQTRELQNGRLAMLAVAGIVAQEIVYEKSVFGTLAGIMN